MTAPGSEGYFMNSARSSMDSSTPLLNNEAVDLSNVNSTTSANNKTSSTTPGTGIPSQITVQKEVNKHLERFKSVLSGLAAVLRVLVAIPVAFLAYIPCNLLMALAWATISFIPTPTNDKGEVDEKSLLYILQVDMGGMYLNVADRLLRAIIGMKQIESNSGESTDNPPENNSSTSAKDTTDSNEPRVPVSEEEPILPFAQKNAYFNISEKDEHEDRDDECASLASSSNKLSASESGIELDSLGSDDESLSDIKEFDEDDSVRDSIESDDPLIKHVRANGNDPVPEEN